MNAVILSALLNTLAALLARIDFLAALQALYTRAAREIPQPVLDRIDILVRRVDSLDLPGEEKFKEVLAALRAPESPVRAALNGVSNRLLHWAIQTAVARLPRT
ncbi:hypothetical protein EOM89_13375 [Candidatus Falkowbacteria bacterium]|nr:hypothetical protein [Candidatus Falkowbacteria bacterium]